MGKILILIAPVVLFVLIMTGTVNTSTLKYNLQALPGQTVQFFKEVASDVGDELSRRFPNLLKRRD